MLYGDGAALELEENAPRGFVARLLLPVERTPARHALPVDPMEAR